MKKIYLSLFAVISTMNVFSQLTQTNHAPVSGDSYEMYQCDSLNVTPGAAGAGVTWNFSMSTHSSVVHTFMAATSANLTYPAATVSVSATGNNSFYYNSSSTGLWYYGGNVNVQTVSGTRTYTAPAINASYPMSLNTTSTAVTGGTLNIMSQNGTFTGTSKTLADGTGTLVLPSMTYSNVTRVVNTQTTNFTAGFITGTLTEMSYEFYNAGTKAPVFRIASINASTPLGTPSQTIVTRMKHPASTVGIDANTASALSVLVFPNPASQVLNVTATDINAEKIVLVDISGKVIGTQSINNTQASMDISNIENGLYFYQVVSKDQSLLKSGKILVQH